ncbi:unnamed protein product [Prunus armeniaca]
MQSGRRSSTMVESAIHRGGRPCKMVGVHPQWSGWPCKVAGVHARWSALIHDDRNLVHVSTHNNNMILDEEPGGVMNVCEGLSGEPNESSEHGQVGVEDLDPLQALRLGLELSVSLP